MSKSTKTRADREISIILPDIYPHFLRVDGAFRTAPIQSSLSNDNLHDRHTVIAKATAGATPDLMMIT
jgi:hypothetical protein